MNYIIPTTVQIYQLSGLMTIYIYVYIYVQHQVVLKKLDVVPMGNASILHGTATVWMTVETTVMKMTAVSYAYSKNTCSLGGVGNAILQDRRRSKIPMTIQLREILQLSAAEVCSCCFMPLCVE